MHNELSLILMDGPTIKHMIPVKLFGVHMLRAKTLGTEKSIQTSAM